MQTREMWNRSKWRVVAGAATLTALGITGLALAETGDDDGGPGSNIELDDLVTMDTFDSPDVGVVDGETDAVSDLDSPLDDSPDDAVAGVEDSPDDGVAGVEDSPDDVDSPDDATETDSPDDVDSPAETDSPDDVDSPAEADSPDVESPDSPDDSA